MKTSIEVKNREEANAIRAGLEDPKVRAFVVIVGTLTPLSKRAQTRILTYVKDALEEQAEGVLETSSERG